jgi:hypothetical protein
MTVPAFPVPLVRSVTRTLTSAVGVSTSPFTLTDQVQDWGGERWAYEIEMAIIQGRNGQVLSAFLAQLGGARGTFLFADPSIRNTTGVGSPLVNGAGQSGNSLVTDGWTATGLKAGDFFSLGTDAATRLYQVTANVVPVAGAATIQFVPRLRSSPADNQALAVVTPQVLLRLTGPAPATVRGADIYQFTISAREAI